MSNAESATPIKLFVLPTGWGIPFATSAPFPLKLETWLRMAGIPYELVVEGNTGKGPKKKAPWIVDGDFAMGDSELIIAYLSDKHGIDLDAHLSPSERAMSVAWHRCFEEHYHQAFEHQLLLGRGSKDRLGEFTKSLPPIARNVLPLVFLSQLRKQLKARGIGRHDEETIIAMGKADLDAASAFLGEKTFFLGEEPAGIDACVFGFLGVTVYVEGDNPLFRYAASLDNLWRYTERMRARYFPETLAKKAESA